jgi:hypothetical protein
MTCLYITPFKPSLQSGGEITVFNNIRILSKIIDKIDYIGIKFDDDLEVNKIHEIDKIGFMDQIKSYLFCYSTISSYSFQILQILEQINLKSYDFIFIESTRFGSLVKYISKYNKNIIVNMHNIELLYFRDARNSLKYFLIRNKIYLSELNSFNYSKNILYLTKKEKEEIKKYFNLIDDSKFIWNPVTYKNIGNIQYNARFRDFVLFTANFNYKPNVDSIQILNKIDNFNIVVAGKGANKLNNIINNHITLVEFPSDKEMDNLMRNAKIFISTVQDGAGMKVKIIEAMAYAIPIVAHKNSLAGYEKVNGVFSYSTENELLSFFNDIDDKRLNVMSNNIKNSFEKYYSYHNVENRYKAFLK